MSSDRSPERSGGGIAGPTAAAFLIISLVSGLKHANQGIDRNAALEERLQEVYSATYLEDGGCLDGTPYDRKGEYDVPSIDFVVDGSSVSAQVLRFTVDKMAEPETIQPDPETDTQTILLEHGCKP